MVGIWKENRIKKKGEKKNNMKYVLLNESFYL